MGQRWGVAVFALMIVAACATPSPTSSPTVAPSPSPIVTAEPSGAPADWLAAVCAAREVSTSEDVPTLIRAISGLDAVTWPAGEVVREPLRRALNYHLDYERNGDIDAAIAAFDAFVEHSDAAMALFGTAEAMCG